MSAFMCRFCVNISVSSLEVNTKSGILGCGEYVFNFLTL